MNRQNAFGGEAKLLKGALHCHTTRSDGRGTPEEVIRLHKQNGYDFMALTDHNIYNYENFAPDVDITILPGVEMNWTISDGGVHCFHEVCVGPLREDGNGYAQDERFDPTRRAKDQHALQPDLDAVHAQNNMTILCHPEWSGTPSSEFDKLRGNFAMEIWNTGCVLDNDQDTNAYGWDDLLMQGQRIWGVAVDDGHAMIQHCKGWVRVNAENNVPAILKALRDGAFYASCGPEIYDFYVQDGVAVLECSPCASAGFRNGHLPTRLTRSAQNDVTRVTFEVPSWMGYVRGVVMDAEGRRAWTNPIFMD